MTTATPSHAGAVEQSQPGSTAEIPLVQRLRLNGSALGIDPRAPDFVVEVLYRSDNLEAGLAKM